MTTAYYRGFRVGLGDTDEPLTDDEWTPLEVISAIEQFVAQEESGWVSGFWDGVTARPKYLDACLNVDICHSMCSGRVMVQNRTHDYIAFSTTEPTKCATADSPGNAIWKLHEAYPELNLANKEEK